MAMNPQGRPATTPRSKEELEAAIVEARKALEAGDTFVAKYLLDDALIPHIAGEDECPTWEDDPVRKRLGL